MLQTAPFRCGRIRASTYLLKAPDALQLLTRYLLLYDQVLVRLLVCDSAISDDFYADELCYEEDQDLRRRLDDEDLPRKSEHRHRQKPSTIEINAHVAVIKHRRAQIA